VESQEGTEYQREKRKVSRSSTPSSWSPSTARAPASTTCLVPLLPRREPCLLHAADGPFRSEARPAHLHQDHGRRPSSRARSTRVTPVIDGPTWASLDAQPAASASVRHIASPEVARLG